MSTKKVEVKVTMDLPDSCSDCMMYSKIPYQCHNEIGTESRCSLGYMKGHDMRDLSFGKSRFEGCKLDDYVLGSSKEDTEDKNTIKVRLSDGTLFIYKKQCKHEKKQYLETINTYDMDGWDIHRDVSVCLDCGLRIEE